VFVLPVPGTRLGDSGSLHLKIGDFGLSTAATLDGDGLARSDSDSSGASSFTAARPPVLTADTGADPAGEPRGGVAGIGGADQVVVDGRQLVTSGSGSAHTSGVGTASYAAPEQLVGVGDYGNAVDVYPLGLILMELLGKFSTGASRFGRVWRPSWECAMAGAQTLDSQACVLGR